MGKHKTVLLSVLFLGMTASAGWAGVISFSSSAPSLGTLDQSQLVSGSSSSPYLDHSSASLEPGRPWLGQTFTVPAGAGAGGAVLKSFALLLADASDGTRTFDAQLTQLSAGNVSGGSTTSFSVLATDSASADETSVDSGGWLTFAFDPSQQPTLIAGQTYGFNISSASSGYGDTVWNDDSTYSPGTGYTIDQGGTSAFGRGADRAFVATLSAVPEPGSIGVLALAAAPLALRRRRAVVAR
jgi:hypothetical protein